MNDNELDYIDRGLSHLRLGKYEEAIVEFNKAIEINPNHAKAYSQRGIAYGN